MTDIVLNNITSGYNISKMNANFNKLEASINTDLLNLAGGNNTMGQDLDLNSHNLLNVGIIDADTINADTVKVGGRTITTSEFVLGPNSVGSENIVDGSITNVKLGSHLDASKFDFLQTGTGAVLKDLLSKSREVLSVRDFGAKGDGTTDDTSAVLAATNEAIASRRALYFPAGTYITDTINMPLSGVSDGFIIYGDGQNSTFIKKKAGNNNPIFIFGAEDNTAFPASVKVRDITFDGNGNSVGIIRTYDLVWSVFSDCTFINGSTGVDMHGGIVVKFEKCIFKFFTFYGIIMTSFTSLAGGGNPNAITLDGCVFGSCLQNAVYFDGGRKLTVVNSDIESSGKVSSPTSGGIYIGPNVGGAVPGAVSVGLRCTDTWFEGNTGVADIVLASANNSIKDCYFVAGASVTNNITVNGGRFNISDCVFDNLKTVNILENAGSVVGNSVSNCPNTNLSIDRIKTLVDGGVKVKGTRVQSGVTSTPSGGVLSVTFPYEFPAIPNVSATVQNNSSGNIIAIEVYNVSTTGFTVHTKAIGGSPLAITNTIAAFHWTAVG